MLSWPAATASNIAGAVLVAVTLRDIFHELFHPGDSGSISQFTQRSLWKGFRHLAGRRRAALRIAGPMILISVVFMWGLLLTLAWTLVFWPYLPEAFRFASPLDPSAQHGFGTALYFSLFSLTTLGLGDITPTDPILRILVTIEAALGFALLTAAISWLLSIYPVLARRRALAQRVWLLWQAQEKSGQNPIDLEPVHAVPLLAELTAKLGQVRVDLVQSGITYYFDDDEKASALPAILPMILQLGEDGMREGRPAAVRFSATALREALRVYLDTVREQHLDRPEEPLGAMLDAYLADHMHEPAGSIPRAQGCR